MTIKNEIQSLDVESPVDLFTLTKFGMPTFRFCNIDTVNFGGLVYIGVSCKTKWLEKSGETTEIRNTLEMSDISGEIGEIIDTYGIIGANLNIKRTLWMFLDGEIAADSTQIIGEFDLRINQYDGTYSKGFNFTLIPTASLERKKIPSGRYTRRCRWNLNMPDAPDANCAAPLSVHFDLAGNPTSVENRACRHDLDACKQYHGHTLNYGGFPGVARNR